MKFDKYNFQTTREIRWKKVIYALIMHELHLKFGKNLNLSTYNFYSRSNANNLCT